MTKGKVIDSAIKDLIKKIDDENIDWASEKENLICRIENMI